MNYTLRNFLPLITMFGIIIVFTIIRQWQSETWNMVNALSDFMGSFFIIFATFKFVHLEHFVEAYRIYDIIAQKNKLYAYAYPCIEFGLGVAYIIRFHPITTSILALLLMTVSSIGVIIELRKKKQIACACLREVFKLPMTYVTLVENCIMSLTALILIIMHVS